MIDQQTCKHCRWWGVQRTDTHREGPFDEAKICGSPHVHFVTTKYQRGDDDLLSVDKPAVLIDADENPIGPADAGVMDGSGYWGALFTRPDFGCVHWEAQP